jgi:prepilin-type N-terminal cleavage/methylation domain-containing protein
LFTILDKVVILEGGEINMKLLRKKRGFTLVEIMIVVAIIGIIIAIAVPAFLRARENARGRACQENMQKIDGAKEQWALEERLSNGTASPELSFFCGPTKWIKREPKCPGGGSYTTNPVGTDPTCSIGANDPFIDHILAAVNE